MASMLDVREVLYSWNAAPRLGVRDVRIDDETLRDGFQGAFAPRITLDQKLEVLRLMDAVGVTYAMLGFPAISEREQRDCLGMIAAIQTERRSIVPCLLGRTHAHDAEVIARLAHESGASLLADLFVGTSPLRRQVEGWSLDQVVERCRTSCGLLARAGVRFALSFEDSSRTPPGELDTLLNLAIDLGCERITICDTVGEALPDGARRIIGHARDLLDRTRTDALLAWHGHNDRGVAVANTLAAADAGADVLSGTFLGLGERAGNAALEQVISYLHAAGSRRYRVELLPKLAELVSRYAEQPIPVTAPIVGLQAFATTAGVHAAALLKARAFGPEFEDLVYSGVPASAFGRSQALGGACGGAAVAVYYRALSTTQMGVTAPLTAVVGTSVPAVIGLASDGSPGSIVLVGFACAVVGIWQLCRPDGSMRPEGIRLALIAGLGFAAFFVCIGQADQAAAPWVAVFSRLASLTVTSAIVTAHRGWRVPARSAVWASLVGIFDALGTLCFIRANQEGRLDIAVVVTSLYPVVTVVLARAVLRERMNRAKVVGMLAALVAVPLIAVR